jgi:hypothetical protein
MGLVTRPVSGLLDLFGTKGQSQNPTQWADFIQPTIECLELLALNVSQSIQTDNARDPGGTGLQQVLTVPPGRIWLVRGFVLDCICGVGDSMTVQPIRFNEAGLAMEVSSNVTTVGASIRRIVGLDPINIRAMSAGERLGYNVVAYTHVTSTLITARATVVECTV